MSPRGGSRPSALHALVARHGLTPEDVAKLARVSVDTARAWLKPETSRSHRTIPAGSLELLRIKLRQRRGRSRR